MATKKKAVKKVKEFSITKKIVLTVNKVIAADNWDDALAKGRELTYKDFVDFKAGVDNVEANDLALEGIYEL